MKNNIYIFMLLVVLATGCLASASSNNTSAVIEPPAIDIRAQSIEPILTPPSQVSAIFKDSDRLTQAIRHTMHTAADNGHDTCITISGVYMATGGRVGRVGRAEVSVAELYNNSTQTGLTDSESTIIDNATSTAISVHNYGGDLLFNLSANVFAHFTGVRGGFNRSISGDPRGFCLFNCDNWHRVSQLVALDVHIVSKGTEQNWNVYAHANQKELIPDELSEAAIKHIAKTLFAVETAGLQ